MQDLDASPRESSQRGKACNVCYDRPAVERTVPESFTPRGAESLSSAGLDGSRWMDEWIERQEKNGVDEDPISNSVLADFDFDSFL